MTAQPATCSDCPLWHFVPELVARDNIKLGQCRAKAPYLIEAAAGPRTRWPIVSESEWCGRHPDR